MSQGAALWLTGLQVSQEQATCRVVFTMAGLLFRVYGYVSVSVCACVYVCVHVSVNVCVSGFTHLWVSM